MAAGDDFKGAMLQRLDHDGVGFAAAQLDPAGLRLHTAGVRRIGEPSPIEADTLFELGSITKTFVALLLADGVLRQRFTLDDPVELGLPDDIRLRDNAGRPLRLIDLATHRSGLPRMPGNLARKELSDPYPYYTEARMFEFLREWKPELGRGKRFEYSNYGYGLLAQVLARRLGLSLDEALLRHVLRPLGLEDMRIARPFPSGDDLAKVSAAMAASIALAPRLAAPHTGERRASSPWRFDAMAGAVGLLGSIESVGRFMQAAVGSFDHPLREAFAMCLQHRTEGEHPLHPFGFGWEMSTIVAAGGSRRRFFNQDGATAGFSTSIWLEPAAGRAGAVLSNAFIETRSLALQALDPSISQQDFNLLVLPAEALQAMVGRWEFEKKFALAISLRNGKLWAQGPGQPELELLPTAPRRLITRGNPIEFAFDETERPQQLTLTKDGQSLTLRRMP